MDQTENHSRVHDRIEIKELRYRYCEYRDEKAWDKWLSLFTEDVVFDASAAPGMDRLEGKEEFREFIETDLAPGAGYSAHHVFHPRIDVDGDEATGRWVLDIISTGPHGNAWWMQGSYFDEYRCVDGEWQFSTVTVTVGAQAEIKGLQIDQPEE